MNNPKFQIPYTAEEWLVAFQSIANKLNKDAVVSTLEGNPTNEQVLGAAALSTALSNLDNKLESDNLLTILQQAADFNMISAEESNKLALLSTKFRGVYVDVSDRDVQLSDVNGANPKQIVNNDLILVMISANGLPSFQVWNNADGRWNDVFDLTRTLKSTIANANVQTEIARFDATKNRSAVYQVRVSSGAQLQVFEVTIAHNGSGSATVSSRSSLLMGTSTDLATFHATTSADNSRAILRCSTAVASSDVLIKQVALL